MEPSYDYGVAGVERPLGTDWRIQLQALVKHHRKYLNPGDQKGGGTFDGLNRSIAEANALIQGYQYQTQTSGTLRLAYEPEGSNLTTEWFTLFNVKGGDYLTRPKITYAWSDALKTTLGVDHYAGNKDRQLGVLKTYNSVFLEGKYTF